MIYVADVNKVKDTNTSKTKKTSSDGNFSEYLRGVVKNTEDGVTGTTTISVAGAIFAAQMVGDEEEQELRKKQIKRGQSLLEKLEEIRNGLLLGYISKESLIEIARFVKERKFEAQDERLNEIISEIELRVEVELAKLMK